MRNEMNIGLLSTAKDFGLVEETLHSMGLVAASTEVTAIITAGNEEGRGNNKFADRTISALSAVGITQVREVDVSGMDEEETRETLKTDEDKSSAQLVVITGGEKQYLSGQMRASGADEVVFERIRAGLPIVTVSAGTVFMGETLEVSGSDENRTEGLGILPATVVCHFDNAKEALVRSAVATGDWSAPIIWGLRDEQALVGNGDIFEVVGKGELTVFMKLPTQTEHQKNSTRVVTL